MKTLLFQEITQDMLIAILVAIGIFFLIRNFFLWYWKVNHRMEQLEQLNANIMLLVEAAGKTPIGKEGKPLEKKSNGQVNYTEKPWWKDQQSWDAEKKKHEDVV